MAGEMVSDTCLEGLEVELELALLMEIPEEMAGFRGVSGYQLRIFIAE